MKILTNSDGKAYLSQNGKVLKSLDGQNLTAIIDVDEWSTDSSKENVIQRKTGEVSNLIARYSLIESMTAMGISIAPEGLKSDPMPGEMEPSITPYTSMSGTMWNMYQGFFVEDPNGLMARYKDLTTMEEVCIYYENFVPAYAIELAVVQDGVIYPLSIGENYTAEEKRKVDTIQPPIFTTNNPPTSTSQGEVGQFWIDYDMMAGRQTVYQCYSSSKSTLNGVSWYMTSWINLSAVSNSKPMLWVNTKPSNPEDFDYSYNFTAGILSVYNQYFGKWIDISTGSVWAVGKDTPGVIGQIIYCQQEKCLYILTSTGWDSEEEITTYNWEKIPTRRHLESTPYYFTDGSIGESVYCEEDKCLWAMVDYTYNEEQSTSYYTWRRLTPRIVTDDNSTSIFCEDNAIYKLDNVAFLTLYYPSSDFSCRFHLKFADDTNETFSIDFPTGTKFANGIRPQFDAGEEWIITIENKCVTATKFEYATD